MRNIFQVRAYFRENSIFFFLLISLKFYEHIIHIFQEFSTHKLFNSDGKRYNLRFINIELHIDNLRYRSNFGDIIWQYRMKTIELIINKKKKSLTLSIYLCQLLIQNLTFFFL